MLMSDVLVIVPCGQRKIWHTQPERGPTRAADAYTGPPFKLNRRYAERFGDKWVILSAKYGFVEPGFVIPECYNVSFNNSKSNPVEFETLRRQAEESRLDRYAVVVGLGGKAYREAVAAAFVSGSARLVFPFAGLPIGRMMQATKRAIEDGRPGFEQELGRWLTCASLPD